MRADFAFTTGSREFKAHVEGGRVQVEGRPESTTADGPMLAFVRELAKIDRQTTAGILDLCYLSMERLDESLDYFGRLIDFTLTRKGGGISNSSLVFGTPLSFSDLLSHEVKLGADGPAVSPGFLTRAAKVMGYDSAAVLYDVEIKTAGAVAEGTLRNLRFSFNVQKDNIMHNSLSYGEKRLLAFFAMSDACPEIMVVDELVNGLHHEWIRACLDEIGKRQAFLTSQNPLLLDYLEFDSPADVQHGFVICERKRDDSGSFLVWRNPTAEEAADFYSAYETGIQRVSDILITKGFW
jgi:hypothetical protein